MPKYNKQPNFVKFCKFNNRLMKKAALFLTFTVFSVRILAQGHLSGDFMMNANFFQRDTSIKASDNPLYDNFLSGAEAWLGLRYNYKGFTANVRADLFNNSNLYNPTQALNGFGLGAWSLSKEVNDLTITVGTIYDQIGSGILFRSYEDRGLLIDNALVGVHLKYKLTKNVFVKGFTGQQKFLFDRYKPVIKGFNAEGDFNIGDKVHLLPGVGALNRTLDQGSMDVIVSNINSQDTNHRFIPRYNMYAFTAYNTLNVGDISWYVEGSYKTHESIVGTTNLLEDKAGNVLFSTLGYARKGFAINLTGKRTENFEMRTSPNEVLIRGLMNWQPIVGRLRPQRLMARYTPASQNLSEIGACGDVLISPNDNFNLTLTYTHINTLAAVKLYREAYAEAEYRGWDDFILTGGVQYMQYNQELYQSKPKVPIINSVTPFFELIYRLDKKRSLRTQWEYQSTAQDYGSWLFGLVEFNIAPKFSFAVSDMYNVTKGPNATGQHHYYSFFTAYTKGPNRFTLAYVKQVDGINCTGGVCRYEPAFSGIKVSCTSTF